MSELNQEEIVEWLLVRKITDADFWNIERGPQTDAQGGSQTYIDLPLGKGLRLLEPLWSFLSVTPAGDEWPVAEIEVAVTGKPEQVQRLELKPRKGNNQRYYIANQARQKRGSNRHPAWTSRNGFPEAPDNIESNRDPRFPDIGHLRIYLVKTNGGRYYAGFLNVSEMPVTWPVGMGLERIFEVKSSDMFHYEKQESPKALPLINRVLRAWSTSKNVLLYGPPGTGKTNAMHVLWNLLSTEATHNTLAFDPSDATNPFRKAEIEQLPFKQPVRLEWVTFHQNFSYENFVLGLRPDTSANGLQLKPRAGVLLDAAISVDPFVEQASEQQFGSAVIFIDELNRGNVSRIFGEFLTFMDDDYRWHDDGNRQAIPVPLPSISVREDGKTEPIERPRGEDVQLQMPWAFPANVYVLASMNSVDRAVAPLDTALARRFSRIDVGPDMVALAKHLGIEDASELVDAAILNTESDYLDADDEDTEAMVDASADARSIELLASEPNSIGAEDQGDPLEQVAWRLLYRLNYELASSLGTDFELGHTYLFPLRDAETADDTLRILARIWDQSLFPLLRERYVNRPEDLNRILRLAGGDANKPAGFLFRARRRPAAASSVSTHRDVYDFPSLEQACERNPDSVRVTLRHLAGM